MEYELAVPAEFADCSAAAISVGEQLTRFGIKTTVRTVTFTQFPIELDARQVPDGDPTAGAPPTRTRTSRSSRTFRAQHRRGRPAGGIKLPAQAEDRRRGDVDLEKMVVDAAQGLDQEAQKAQVTKLALAFNELMPKIPIYERYGNNPAPEAYPRHRLAEGRRPDLPQQPLRRLLRVMLMYEGKLQPV